jgi:hypothetical protein
MDKETAKRLTSPCGIPCFHCVAYLARISPEIRKKVLEALGIPGEKATCEGCRPEGGRIKLLKGMP